MKSANPAGISEKVIRLLEIYTLIAQNKYPSLDFLMDRFPRNDIPRNRKNIA